MKAEELLQKLQQENEEKSSAVAVSAAQSAAVANANANTNANTNANAKAKATQENESEIKRERNGESNPTPGSDLHRFDLVFLDADKKSYLRYVETLIGESLTGENGSASDCNSGRTGNNGYSEYDVPVLR